MNILIVLLTLGSPAISPASPVSDATVAMGRCHPYAHKVHGCGREGEPTARDKAWVAERDTTCRQLPGKLRLCDMRPQSEKRFPQEMRVNNEPKAKSDG